MIKYIEIEGEGFQSLLGQEITLFCDTYIYAGKLIGVNQTCVLLGKPKIVYLTGPFTTNEWEDAQDLPNNIYVQVSKVEAFGVVK